MDIFLSDDQFCIFFLKTGTKSLIFWDTTDHLDPKNPLSVPDLSPEKPLAEILSLKKWPQLLSLKQFSNDLQGPSMTSNDLQWPSR